MARTYNRDSRGRFASGGGGSTSSKPATVGRSGPRGGKTGTRAEQRRAAREQAARSAAFRGKATGSGRDARAAYRSAAGAARSARRQGPASNIRPTARGGSPLAPRANGIRPYRPATLNGAFDRTDRRVDKSLKEMSDIVGDTRKITRENREYKRWKARQQARALADRSKGGIDKELADITLKHFGWRLGAQQIKHRARRAARRAAAGSKVAARALQIYDQQLAFTGTGKPSRRAKNAIKPGPRNANPPKKPPRKPRKRKPKG